MIINSQSPLTIPVNRPMNNINLTNQLNTETNKSTLTVDKKFSNTLTSK